MKRLLIALVLSGALVCNGAAASNSGSEALPALIRVLAKSEDPQFQLDILKGMSDGLKGRRRVEMPAGWEEAAGKLSRSANPQIRELVQALSLTFGSASALAALRQTLADPKAKLQARTNALDSLLQARDPALPASLRGLLKEPYLRGPALRGLAAYDDPKTPPAILEAYPSLNPVERKDALNTLAARLGFAKSLLAAVGDKTISPKDLTADIVRQLRNLKDPQIDGEVQKLWGLARETGADKLKEIAKYKNLIQSKGSGNTSRGRGVFSRVCQQCHTLFDTGGKVGPELTGSNRSDLDYILQNVIDPNAIIPNDYRTSTLETRDERVITGIASKQDNNAVTIVTPNDTIVVPRTDIKSLRQSDVSMMPEGLLQSLGAEE